MYLFSLNVYLSPVLCLLVFDVCQSYPKLVDNYEKYGGHTREANIVTFPKVIRQLPIFESLQSEATKLTPDAFKTSENEIPSFETSDDKKSYPKFVVDYEKDGGQAREAKIAVLPKVIRQLPFFKSFESPFHSNAASSSSLSRDATKLTPDQMDSNEMPASETSDVKKICGRRVFRNAKIVGGKKAPIGSWPWQISLRKRNGTTYSHICGAVLVNENWAITAAHCVDEFSISELLLRLGNQNRLDDDEPNKTEDRKVDIVALHPQYHAQTWENDLALLRFRKPVEFQYNIIPVCLPENDNSFVGSEAYATGWGTVSEGGPLSEVLREVAVPIISNKDCETMYRSAGLFERIPKMFLCAGSRKGGFDPCEGDSGGPLVVERPDQTWVLAGITSWGEGCARPNQPGVYTRISRSRKWINQLIKI